MLPSLSHLIIHFIFFTDQNLGLCILSSDLKSDLIVKIDTFLFRLSSKLGELNLDSGIKGNESRVIFRSESRHRCKGK